MLSLGVGNAIFPLLELNNDLQVFAFDFAKSAIELMKTNPLYYELNKSSSSFRVLGQVSDITGQLPLLDGSVDLCLCMFVLSAIAPFNQPAVFREMARVLKPGGKVLIRDYGRFDEAQLRFKGSNKIHENFYARQDGTCAYYFTTEELHSLASDAGLAVEENEYLRRKFINRSQQKCRFRIWIHAKFVKK